MIEHYIQIDSHQAFFQACALDRLGTRLWEDRFPHTDDGIAAVLARCDHRAAIAVEASTPTGTSRMRSAIGSATCALSTR